MDCQKTTLNTPAEFTPDRVYNFLAERWGAADCYANNSWDLVETFLTDISTDFSSSDIPVASVSFPSTPPVLSSNLAGLKPDAPDTAFSTGTLPTAPSLDNVDSGNYPTIPEFTDTPDAITIPNSPSTALPASPGDAPALTDIVLPTPLVVSFPAAPVISDIIMPDALVLDTIQFEGILPTFNEEAPAGMFVYNEQVYNSLLKDPLDAKILADIIAGGTGLNPAAEEAIYQRARGRLDIERGIQHTDTLNYFASRGYVLPPGAVQARLTEIDRKFTNGLEDLNRDILVKQAELTWQNLKETITAGMERENTLMTYANSVAQRAFESAKYALEAGILIYNAKVTAYNTKLEGYKTQATVYTERIRAQLAEVEVYKAQLEGKKVESEVQQYLVAIYEAQLNAVRTEADIYNARLQSSALVASIDKLKIEAYGVTVDAYKAKVDARTAEFGMYQAQIAGELAKVEVYKEKVNAYTALVAGKKTQIDAEVAKITAQVQANNSKIASYATELEGYKAEIAGNTAQLDAKVKVYGAETTMYGADIQAQVADMQGQIEQYRARVQESISNTEISLKEAQVNIDAALRQNALQTEANKSGANVAAQIVASALSSVNASAQLGWNGSTSSNETFDRTKGYDAGQQVFLNKNCNICE